MIPTPQTISREIHRAYEARDAGKLGLARVCARRAAGWAIQLYLSNRGIILGNPSALEHIKYLLGQDNVGQNTRKVLEYLVQRVAKEEGDTDSFWPLPEVDLVQEAHWLVESLLSVRITPVEGHLD